MSRVAVYSLKSVYERGTPAGPAIRALEMSRALADAGHDVLFVEPGRDLPESDGNLRIRSWTDDLRNDRPDVVVVPQELVGQVETPAAPTVVDLFDPHFLSCLFNGPDHFDYAAGHYYAEKLDALATALRTGDHFLCCGPRQRIFYLGMLQVLGRIHPGNVRDLDGLISVVPIAAATEPPRASEAPLFRGVHCPADAPVMLWSSGIYPFLDADIVLDAFERVRQRIPTAWLVFVGIDAPNAPEMQAGADQLRRRVQEAQLEGNGIAFLPWQPYESRGQMYAEADIGIALSPPHLETEVGFRHRVVDMLWGGLPVITTANNDLADMIQREDAGRLLRRFDAMAVADTICDLLGDEAERARLSDAARELVAGPLSWRKAVAPLDDFCRSPRRAADLGDAVLGHTVRRVLGRQKATGLLEKLRISRDVRGGWLGMLLRRPPVH